VEFDLASSSSAGLHMRTLHALTFYSMMSNLRAPAGLGSCFVSVGRVPSNFGELGNQLYSVTFVTVILSLGSTRNFTGAPTFHNIAVGFCPKAHMQGKFLHLGERRMNAEKVRATDKGR